MINYDYADGPTPGSSTSVSPDPTHEGFWGRLKSFNFKNDTTYKNSYTYDGTGRLDQIKADHSTSTVFDYTYHVKANVVDYLQHGSYSQDVVYRSDSYLQDKLIHKWGSDLTKDQEARYTYDTLGRRSYEKTSGVVVEDLRPTKDRWGALTSYNDRNELTGYRLYEMNTSWSVSSTTAIAGTRQSYTLDHMGNRTGGHQNDVSGTYTSSNPHDGLNQYSTARNLTVDYDNAGNMTDYGTKDYAYDAEDRLVKVTVGTTHYKYKYDYLGRRIGKYTGSTLNKKFVYQGWNLIAELSSTGSVQRTFTWGLDVSTTLHGAGGVGGLLMIDDESTSKRYYPIYDGSRNIVGLYDQTGALVASYEYDAFGRIILQSSGDYSDDNPFRFSTKYTDDETGLVYYGHRYYEPELGRFINRDPIEEDGGLNLYGFVGNDPVNFYDYLGMILWIPLWAYDFENENDQVNEEADPDILDDELRDEAEGRARAIAMERAGGLLSWIVQGAPVTYLDRLEGLYEAALDRVDEAYARYYDEIEESRSLQRIQRIEGLRADLDKGFGSDGSISGFGKGETAIYGKIVYDGPEYLIVSRWHHFSGGFKQAVPGLRDAVKEARDLSIPKDGSLFYRPVAVIHKITSPIVRAVADFGLGTARMAEAVFGRRISQVPTSANIMWDEMELEINSKLNEAGGRILEYQLGFPREDDE